MASETWAVGAGGGGGQGRGGVGYPIIALLWNDCTNITLPQACRGCLVIVVTTRGETARTHRFLPGTREGQVHGHSSGDRQA